MTQLSPLLTAGEVAKRYGTTAETVRRWAKEGKLPASAVVTMPSGRLKFRRAEIDEIAPLGQPEPVAS